MIDGVDIRQIHLTSLRQNIALVSQEVYLFHGTIEENIAYGKTNVKIEEVRAAAQQAQLHAWNQVIRRLKTKIKYRQSHP